MAFTSKPLLKLSLSSSAGSTEDMVRIEGGAFHMGAEGPECWAADGESPRRKVSLDPYFLDHTSVTNETFASFVEATGYQSEAERFGWSFVFEGALSDEASSKITQAVAAAPWWLPVPGSELPAGGETIPMCVEDLGLPGG